MNNKIISKLAKRMDSIIILASLVLIGGGAMSIGFIFGLLLII